MRRTSRDPEEHKVERRAVKRGARLLRCCKEIQSGELGRVSSWDGSEEVYDERTKDHECPCSAAKLRPPRRFTSHSPFATTHTPSPVCPLCSDSHPKEDIVVIVVDSCNIRVFGARYRTCVSLARLRRSGGIKLKSGRRGRAQSFCAHSKLASRSKKMLRTNI